MGTQSAGLPLRSTLSDSRWTCACRSFTRCQSGGEHACGNDVQARVSVLDAKILTAIKDDLLNPERLKLMERAMRDHFQSRIEGIKVAKLAEQSEARLSAVEVEISNVVSAIAKVGLNENLTKKLDELTAEKKALSAEKRTSKADPRLAHDLAALVPRLMEHNIRVLRDLARRCTAKTVVRRTGVSRRCDGWWAASPLSRTRRAYSLRGLS